MNRELLIASARALARPFAPTDDLRAGVVAAALLTRNGDLFAGVCIDAASSIGFCAEHAAVAEMLKMRQAEVEIIVAVNSRGKIVPPCGRCRELLRQLHPGNTNTLVVLSVDRVGELAELLPDR